MLRLEENCLANGEIKSKLDLQWHYFTMRILQKKDLPDVLELYDFVMSKLDRADILWRYPDEKVAAFLSNKAIAAGVFVNDRLVGVRVLYFHDKDDKDDLDNPLVSIGLPYNETAHSALCVVHPEFRGNSLQRRMGIQILKVAQARKPFKNFCSIVAPQNYPSMQDKFSLNMLVVRLMPKFSGIWRYIFYKNMDQGWQMDNTNRVFVPSSDYSQQIQLIEQGYYGLGLEKTTDGVGIYFGRRETFV